MFRGATGALIWLWNFLELCRMMNTLKSGKYCDRQSGLAGFKPTHPNGGAMKQRCLLAVLVLLITPLLRAQSTPYQLKPILDRELQSPKVVEFQLQQFLMRQVPKLPTVTTPEKWTSEEERIRKWVLAIAVFHGWPS